MELKFSSSEKSLLLESIILADDGFSISCSRIIFSRSSRQRCSFPRINIIGLFLFNYRLNQT